MNGATASSAAIAAVATSIVRGADGLAPPTEAIPLAGLATAMLTLLPEQAGGLDQQDDHHDDEDDGIRGFRVEDLGQAFDDAQPEAREDRPENRAHAADH